MPCVSQPSAIQRSIRGISAVLVALVLLGGSALVWGDTVTAAVGQDRPPFISGQPPGGLEIEIVRAALKESGHSLAVVSLPNARLKALGERGWREVDAVVGVREVYGGGYRSDSYIAFHNYAITKTGLGIAIDEVADLKGRAVVAWQNAWSDLGEPYRQLFGPEGRHTLQADYYEHPDQRKQVEMFWRGRAEVLIIDKTVFEWQSRRLAGHIDTREPVTYHDIFARETPFYVVFGQASLRDDFNRGLSIIKKTGHYQTLLQRYLE